MPCFYSEYANVLLPLLDKYSASVDKLGRLLLQTFYSHQMLMPVEERLMNGNLCPFGSRYLISVYGCSCAGLLCHRIKFFHLIHEPFKLFFFLKLTIHLPECAEEQLTRNRFQGCSGSCTSFRCPACWTAHQKLLPRVFRLLHKLQVYCLFSTRFKEMLQWRSHKAWGRAFTLWGDCATATYDLLCSSLFCHWPLYNASHQN